MGVLRLRRHNHRPPSVRAAAATVLLLLLLLDSAASAMSLTQLFGGNGARRQKKRVHGGATLGRVLFGAGVKRQGPGSSPPSCRSKCGRCSPCKAVHVPIQPGMSMPLEYYPEAWRCKCGNKLYMP